MSAERYHRLAARIVREGLIERVGGRSDREDYSVVFEIGGHALAAFDGTDALRIGEYRRALSWELEHLVVRALEEQAQEEVARAG